MKFITLIILFSFLKADFASFHTMKIKDINGKELKLSSFKGKKVIVVNVASECGYTKQYTELQELYSKYKKKLVIIGMPCNDFGGQEPGTEEEIQSFCNVNYKITFPLTEKIGIKQNTHPVYQWLTQKTLNGVSDNEVKWNFHKFLIDEKGKLVKSLPSKITPLDESIISWVEAKKG
jgi:glutathione peroxidase